MIFRLKDHLASPLGVRVAPFVAFVLLTFLQGKAGTDSIFWIYVLKSAIGAVFVWFMWPLVLEMRWRFSIEAVIAGILVFVVWVGLDPFYPRLNDVLGKMGIHTGTAGDSLVWNPKERFGPDSGWAWFFIGVRLLASTLVVPPLEEVFYRSFLYRYIVRQDFTSVPIGQFHLVAFISTSIVFGLAHGEWLAGIICGLIYQWLVCWKRRLGDAMTAHAITNLLLGGWIIWKGAWHFW